jgi:rhodanese-related sulfurtransferase
MSELNLARSNPPKDHMSLRTPTTMSTGMVMLDPFWGTVQPIVAYPGVVTIGELELMEHIRNNGAVIDTRQARYLESGGRIPTALHAPWQSIVAEVQSYIERGVLTKHSVLALYCNGPQCPATQKAIRLLVESGWREDQLLYYRGGIMDWVSLGLPLYNHIEE